MKKYESIDDIKSIDIRDYINSLGIKITNNRCICPIHGGTRNNSEIKHNKLYCHKGCDKSMDILDLIQAYHNVNFIKSKAIAREFIGNKTHSSVYNREEDKQQEEEKDKKTKKMLYAIRNNKTPIEKNMICKAYLHNRGLSKTILELNKRTNINLKVYANVFKGEYIIYDFKKKGQDLNEGFIIKKNIHPTSQADKVRNIGKVQPVIINPYKSNEYAIVEGIEDALSVIEMGYNAISLNSVSNVNNLLQQLEKHISWSKKQIFTILTDTDKAGREANNKLEAGLTKLNCKFTDTTKIIGDMIRKNCKDPNEYLVITNGKQ